MGDYRIEVEIFRGDWLAFADRYASESEAQAAITLARTDDADYDGARFRVLRCVAGTWTVTTVV